MSILQAHVMVALTALMVQSNGCMYTLQRIVNVGELHYKKRNYDNEGLTLFTENTSPSYPAMECEWQRYLERPGSCNRDDEIFKKS